MFSVRITDIGMREPHWHPETAEMGYVTSGRGHMTILSPGGHTETFEIKPGDTYFIPPAYPHHIENIGSGTLHILIFFDSQFRVMLDFRRSPPAIRERSWKRHSVSAMQRCQSFQ
jgi:oxalate decarboxylase/phosphoglucose isomerase-like protein (cupin superfamily)